MQIACRDRPAASFSREISVRFAELMPASLRYLGAQQRVNGTGQEPAVHPKGHPAKLPDGLFASLPQQRSSTASLGGPIRVIEVRRTGADFLQGQLAEHIGIAILGLRKLDDLPSDQLTNQPKPPTTPRDILATTSKNGE